MTAALEVHGLTKRYGSHVAVDGLDLTVPAGSLTCLIGPNGAGKSTTMRTIAGLQMADAGRVVVQGVDVTTDPAEARRRTALTPQDLALFEFLTAHETLGVVGRLRGLDDATLDERRDRWLELTGLARDRDRVVTTFSGGMKRKLAIASALIGDPALAILDESFTGLDPESTDAIRHELRAFCDAGGAVLLSSHVLDMVQAIADHVVLVARGQHVATLSRAEMDESIPSKWPSLTAWYLDLTQTGRSETA